MEHIEQWRKEEARVYQLPLQRSDFNVVPAMGAKILGDIMMNCQVALHTKLKHFGEYAEIDLTYSLRPWPRIIAANKKRFEIIGAGIVRFAIAVRSDKICPHQEKPIVHFVVDRSDGSTITFSDPRRTDGDFRTACTLQDRRLAFRLAAGWSVHGRWEALKECVFVRLIMEFQRQHRPDGWLDSDFEFLPRDGKRTLFAWTLSDQLQISFRYWLVIGRKTCPAIVTLRGSVVDDRLLTQTLDRSIYACVEETAVSCHDSHEASAQPEPYASPPLLASAGQVPRASSRNILARSGFGPLQRLMLEDCLKEARYKSLDPPRDARAEDTYGALRKWFDARDGGVRFSHDSISSYFRHGGHEYESTKSFVDELVAGRVVAGRVPSLVCIWYVGAYRVIFGNRRLHAYRECASRIRSEVWFQMIVHEFPTCSASRDSSPREEFRLKAIHAMSTATDGRTVCTN